MKQIFFFFITLLVGFSFVSCEVTIDESESDELLRLQAYMGIHYPNLQPTQSGLYYIIHEQGDGEAAETDDFILYNYSVMGLSGVVVETNIKSTAYLYDLYSSTSRYAPAFSAYNESLIKGLIEGISYLKPPAKARFIMPSSLAFGGSMFKGLNPYSSIIYDLELIKVVSDPEAYEQAIIDDYLADYFPFGIEDTILYDGVYYLELAEGEGEYFKDNENVEMNYIGRFVDGTVFDTNIKAVAVENNIYQSGKSYLPFEVIVGSNDVIEGFSLVLKRLKPEGNAKVIITSSKAYGAVGSSTIRPYEPLIFEIFILTEAEDTTNDEDK